MLKATALAAIALFFGATASAWSQTRSVHVQADYTVSYLGIPVAMSQFDSIISSSSYKTTGTLRSAGIVDIFDRTRGTTSVSGRFSRGYTRPAAFRTDYSTGGEDKMISMRFSAGAVTRVDLKPATKKRGDDWVPVSKASLQSVTDPLSSTMVQAESAETVCNRTLNYYDGELRADIELSPAGYEQVSIPGFKGSAVSCTARFVPVGGYRANHSGIRYLRDRSRIRIAFAEVGGTSIYAPVRASVSTRIGAIVIRATKLEAR
ncbi:DUF3108 domain-containing protein [Limoniibacter endophyticus]|uniref:DUF3108 domain-containing protein n=1 Tax=Limoniibacter endophyticus TaxID=1565040 RepID=A0A8J3GJ77_9HYPH|nr:DUF3108 domain-containing protein [Limoniibacter endophyticus]GHC76363.1 hypothetical protein GCM10010136_27000 [Limoniibacter endophyticus]